MKKFAWTVFCLPLVANAQKVVEQPVNIIYGNKVIHTYHQVVLSTPEDVTVIPAQKAKPSIGGPNVVVSPDGSTRTYLEENAIAAREKAIYDEVNRRTEEAPFTVLFTGHIPEKIQEKRLRMMPEVGIFGDQLSKLNKDEQAQVKKSEEAQGIDPQLGDFAAISPDGKGKESAKGNQSGSKASDGKVPSNKEKGAEAKKMSQEAKLEQLIGGG